ncbi:ead/Ea22-like family protein [Escherichia coli]|uniref:ead/Ea22-like family protein n=4 Tax=Escherichia coli TaxID=562 RepID=UPI0002243360|nr:ead/Ea22-like family protein [Escherichia coli]HDQ6930919.1 ead/Ea22-like family protein [Escherichia coli O146:H21]HDQ6976025.1 ead/Ea22-like family protein [Escherichia coli O166:H28]EEC7603120.1 ead/Ea22-like family protein [Escherichia coli]EEC8686897.1 ead/Ea22-like family protein [Escherichia coli]EEC8878592.1 ead/Ea22-like family protein [Escherichia coli]
MTTEIDYQVLRDVSERAITAMTHLSILPGDDDLLSEKKLKELGIDIDAIHAFKIMAGPETVLSLLDERDALNERIAELEANLAKLAEDQQKAIESIKQADSAVKLAHEKFSALAAENAELKAFKTAVYQQMGVGCDAPEFSITVGLSNLRRFADTLHAIEREFFTKELPDEEHEGETFNECPLSWGMSVEQYVSEFRKCLAEVRAQGVEMLAKNHQSIVNALKGDSLFSDGEYRHAIIASAATSFAAELRKGGNQ